MRARDLPADLIREWAARQTAASAKLEGRELPKDYVRPLGVEEFLRRRMNQNLRRQGGVAIFPDADYDMFVEPPPPDASLGLTPMRNFNGQIVSWIRD